MSTSRITSLLSFCFPKSALGLALFALAQTLSERTISSIIFVKTTLFNHITGYCRPSSAEIKFSINDKADLILSINDKYKGL